MTDNERLLQIKRAHASGRPSDANPAWKNSHNDLGFVLAYLEAARDQRQYATEITLANALYKLIDKIHTGLDSGDILEDAETAMESLDRATPADQEPVQWMVTNVIYGSVSFHTEEKEARAFTGGQYKVEPLYATPADHISQARDAWQPIETAPAEGQFLVYMPDEKRQPIQVAKWRPNLKVIGNAFAFDMETPTHWQPLPAPPEKPAGDVSDS